MVHVGEKSPWAGAVIAIVLLYCLANAGCSGFSFASNHSSPSTGGSGSGSGGTNPAPPTTTISGAVGPAALGAGATVYLTGTVTANTTTDSSGSYSFTGLPSGSYTLTPMKAGVSFSPASLNITLSGSPVADVNFVASEPAQSATISGSITPATLGAGITVNLSGVVTANTTTNSSGNYSFVGLPSGTYKVTPVESGVVFSPASLNITLSGSPITDANFAASEPTQTTTISGSITPTPLGAGIAVHLTGPVSAGTTTDNSGHYSFGGLSSGTYTVTPVKSGVVFSPASLNVTATSSPVTGANFTASDPLTPSGPIVINGENGTTIQGLKITSATGDCVTITNSTNITILNSEIGPCAGNGIVIDGGTGISIYDSYIHPEKLATGCCDHNDGIFAKGNPSNLEIQGNVIAYGESNVEVHGGTTVSVIGNLLLNPRGPSPSRGNNFQCWDNCSGVVVQNNYALSSDDTSEYLYPEATQDSISFGASDSFIVRGNLITGGHSAAGCGIMADTFSNQGQILQNQLLNTGQCGIGLTDGTQVADSNLVYNTTPVSGSGNTAMYVAHFGQSLTCGPMTITNNISDEIRPDGTHSGWWNAENCGPIDIGTDVFGAAADSSLTPVATVFTQPLIPPAPKNCVAISPYSTQTSAAACIP